MHTELAWLKAIAPDLMGVVTKRYQVLQFINWMAPVGRRTLAEQMKIHFYLWQMEKNRMFPIP